MFFGLTPIRLQQNKRGGFSKTKINTDLSAKRHLSLYSTPIVKTIACLFKIHITEMWDLNLFIGEYND